MCNSQTFPEILGAVPSLRYLNNGMTFDSAHGATLFLDKGNWTEGEWDGGLDIELVTLVSIPHASCCLLTCIRRTRTFVSVRDGDEAEGRPSKRCDTVHDGGAGHRNAAICCRPAVDTPSMVVPPRLNDPLIMSYITDNGTCPRAIIPDDIPADIQRLSLTYKDGTPVAIISHVDWPHFPFRMSSDRCRIVVLGFFHVISAHVSVRVSQFIVLSNLLTRRIPS